MRGKWDWIELKIGGGKEGAEGKREGGKRRFPPCILDALYVQDEHDSGPMEGVLLS